MAVGVFDIPHVRALAHGPGSSGQRVEVVLLDRDGIIVWANNAWLEHGRSNGGHESSTGVGASYLQACDAASGDPVVNQIAASIRAACNGRLLTPVAVRIPCHGPDSHHWYDLVIAPRVHDDGAPAGAMITLAPVADDAEQLGKLQRLHDESLVASALHELVFQRLFGTGLQLQALTHALPDTDTQARVQECVDTLDAAAQEVHLIISALRELPR